MNEKNNINEITEKYQELYGIDVEVKYDEETAEYIILDENGNEINRISSLSEEIEELDDIENDNNNIDSSNYVGSYSSSSRTPPVSQMSNSPRMIAIDMGVFGESS